MRLPRRAEEEPLTVPTSCASAAVEISAMPEADGWSGLAPGPLGWASPASLPPGDGVIIAHSSGGGDTFPAQAKVLQHLSKSSRYSSTMVGSSSMSTFATIIFVRGPDLRPACMSRKKPVNLSMRPRATSSFSAVICRARCRIRYECVSDKPSVAVTPRHGAQVFAMHTTPCMNSGRGVCHEPRCKQRVARASTHFQSLQECLRSLFLVERRSHCGCHLSSSTRISDKASPG